MSHFARVCLVNERGGRMNYFKGLFMFEPTRPNIFLLIWIWTSLFFSIKYFENWIMELDDV